ncbi:hypothetical protein ATK30_1862 [Amycolatopsis echigonensis]|uniref:Uncharacterized protein n=1 Tax=Amycolatopsis echigonensis TaxID=2576905 RepID=A0A2N3WB48_9PSEU|nr:hypothetical protein ATK30_1862 [Amycolatopsis niigatensis]
MRRLVARCGLGGHGAEDLATPARNPPPEGGCPGQRSRRCEDRAAAAGKRGSRAGGRDGAFRLVVRELCGSAARSRGGGARTVVRVAARVHSGWWRANRPEMPPVRRTGGDQTAVRGGQSVGVWLLVRRASPAKERQARQSLMRTMRRVGAIRRETPFPATKPGEPPTRNPAPSGRSARQLRRRKNHPSGFTHLRIKDPKNTASAERPSRRATSGLVRARKA